MAAGKDHHGSTITFAQVFCLSHLCRASIGLCHSRPLEGGGVSLEGGHVGMGDCCMMVLARCVCERLCQLWHPQGQDSHDHDERKSCSSSTSVTQGVVTVAANRTQQGQGHGLRSGAGAGDCESCCILLLPSMIIASSFGWLRDHRKLQSSPIGNANKGFLAVATNSSVVALV